MLSTAVACTGAYSPRGDYSYTQQKKMALQATVLPFGPTAPPAPLWSSGPTLGQFYSFPGNGVRSVGPQLPVTHTRFELGQIRPKLFLLMLYILIASNALCCICM